MKTLLLSLFVMAFALATAPSAKAQCESDAYTETCIGKLPDGYTFIKSFAIDGESGTKSKVEYSYVFSKDAKYLLSICAGGDNTDGIVVTMYDSNRRKVGSNLVNGTLHSAFIYPCNATGIYYLTFTFNGSTKYCGGSVLGFKR